MKKKNFNFQNYISWTQENNNNLRFGETNTGGFVSVNTMTNKTATHTYDIETFHLYAQPDAQSMILNISVVLKAKGDLIMNEGLKSAW